MSVETDEGLDGQASYDGRDYRQDWSASRVCDNRIDSIHGRKQSVLAKMVMLCFAADLRWD